MVIWTSCAAFFRLILPSMMDRTPSKSKAPGQLKASWIILRNGNAQLSQLTTNSGVAHFALSFNSGFAQIPRMAYGAPCGVCA